MPERRTDVAKLTTLRLAKGKKGWSMRELARRANVAYSHVREVNAGRRHFGKHTAPLIATALGCKVDDFTTLADDRAVA